jgi:multidrug transporter EmrE-like cation transporter
MLILYAIFFGAGVAGFAYTKIGRRVGFDNQQSVWTVVGVSFVIASIFFYTLLTTVLHVH